MSEFELEIITTSLLLMGYLLYQAIRRNGRRQ